MHSPFYHSPRDKPRAARLPYLKSKNTSPEQNRNKRNTDYNAGPWVKTVAMRKFSYAQSTHAEVLILLDYQLICWNGLRFPSAARLSIIDGLQDGMKLWGIWTYRGCTWYLYGKRNRVNFMCCIRFLTPTIGFFFRYMKELTSVNLFKWISKPWWWYDE